MEAPETKKPKQPSLSSFLMDDAKKNYQAFTMNEEQRRQDERYKKLMEDLDLIQDLNDFKNL